MIKLRALEPTDLPYLYQWENDAAMWADSDTHNPLSQHLLREYIDSQTGDLFRDGQLRLIIEKIDDDRIETVGCIDLFDLDAINRKAAIGMYVAQHARAGGVGSRALNLLEDYAFRILHLHQIYAIIAEDNTACIHLFQQAGYHQSSPLKDWILRDEHYVCAYLFQKTH